MDAATSHDALYLLFGGFLGSAVTWIGWSGHVREQEKRRRMAQWRRERQARTSSLGYVPRSIYKGESR